MINFIKQFFLHPKQVGSVIPSGPELVKLMLEPIDFSKTAHLVELGPGTGVITKEVLKRMRIDARLTVIEINKEFCKDLRKISDPRLHVIEGDATTLSKYVEKADYIISGLPLANFEKNDVKKILREAKSIKKHAYIQYNYSPAREGIYKKAFSKVTKKITLKNIPPAIVYVCT